MLINSNIHSFNNFPLFLYFYDLQLLHGISVMTTQECEPLAMATMWRKILTAENIDEFDEFSAICH